MSWRFSSFPFSWLLVVAAYACGEKQAGGIADASAEEAPSVRIPEPPTDGAVEAGAPSDPCTKILVPSVGCTHPAVKAVCAEGWCRIPKGCFILGSPPCEPGHGLYDEDQIQVTLSYDFEIQPTEMSQEQWAALGFVNPSTVIEAGTYYPEQTDYGDCIGPTCPVGNITIEEAMAGANALSKRASLPECYSLSDCSGTVGSGLSCKKIEATTERLYNCRGYRLPTEAEWEYAARAGTTSPVFAGELAPLKQGSECRHDTILEGIAWYCINSGRRSHPVAEKGANAWGLFDTSGNVFEWTTSAYTGGGYGPSPQIDPMPKLSSTRFVFRGGGAHVWSTLARAADRSQCLPHGLASPLLGVRYVRTL